MGYYTRYNLTVKNISPDEAELLDARFNEMDLFGYVFERGYYWPEKKEATFSCWEEQKWYEHEEGLVDVSKLFPEAMFELNCVGEDGECWKEYYMNGESECCYGEMVFKKPSKIPWFEKLVKTD